jgi:hypothetical protein
LLLKHSADAGVPKPEDHRKFLTDAVSMRPIYVYYEINLWALAYADLTTNRRILTEMEQQTDWKRK